MGNPVLGGTTSSEGGFEATVETFKDAIGLGMESCCGDVRNVEERGKIGPKG